MSLLEERLAKVREFISDYPDDALRMLVEYEDLLTTLKDRDMNKPSMPDTTCDNCGHPQREHWALNFADGPHVSGSVLVCPTAVFSHSLTLQQCDCDQRGNPDANAHASDCIYRSGSTMDR